MTRMNWSVRVLIATVVTAVVTASFAGPANADPVVVPSSMTVSPANAGGQVSDWWSGPAFKLWSNGSVSIPVVTANAGGRLEVRARGENCFGAPAVAVKRGGVTLTAGTLGSGWNTYTVGLGAQVGSAPVTIEFTNDYRWWLCDRNVYISSVTVRDGPGSVTPTPTPTPTPTTTVPTTTVPTTTVPTTTVPTTTVPTTTVPTTTVPTTTVPTTTVPTTTVPTTTLPTTTVPTTTAPPTTTTPVPSTRCPVNLFEARYFNNATTSGAPVAVQCENAPGGSFTGSPLAGVNADGYAVEYVGDIDFPQTTSYIVSATLGNVAARVWIDDALVLDRPNAQWATVNTPRTVSAGVHRVRVAYANPSGVAHFGFSLPRATPGAPSNNGNYFAADSFWNQPVPPNATVDPRSAGWIATVDAGSNGVSVNSQQWSTTVYNAPPGTPTTDVFVSNSNRWLTIPYSTAYRPSQDSDAHLAVIDDATGCLYEFQGFDPRNRTAIASATYRAYTGSGGHVAGPSHAGGEFSYLAGMITPQDVQSGVIDHALRYALPWGSPNYAYPGTRSDGTTAGGVPQGTRMQLDPSLDLSSFGLSPFQLMVARALQVYGGFNADHAGAFVLNARSPLDGSTYAQPIQPLPDSLIRYMRFLSPTIPSTQIYLDRADDPGCNQQR